MARRMLALQSMKHPAPAHPPGSLHSVVAHVAETCLRTHGAEWNLSSIGRAPGAKPRGCLSAVEVNWPAETLLVGAADTSVFTDFSQRARAEALAVLFYESTAMGRWTEGPAGRALLDLIVRPRVGVRSTADAARARELLGQVQRSCVVGREIGTGFAIDPVVEVWQPREPAVTSELGQPGLAGHYYGSEPH